MKHMSTLARHITWLGLEAPDAESSGIVENREELKEFLNALKGKDPGLGDVAEQAERAGVQVVLYDYDQFNNPKSLEIKLVQLGVPERGGKKFSAWEFANRLRMMNVYAADKINGDHNLFGRRYLILVGADHIDPEKCEPLQALLRPAPIAIAPTQ